MGYLKLTNSFLEKILNNQADLILGVHDRSYSSVKEKLLASESCASIKSIFKMYET